MISFLELTGNYCQDLGPVISILKAVLNLIRWGISGVVLLLGVIDMAKAAMASKDDEIKKAQKAFITRIIYAVVIFLVPTIVDLVFGIVGNSGAEGTDNFFNCW